MEIRYVNHGIANNFGDYIELNEGLKEYPDLHTAVLKHELSHTNQSGFTKKDFMVDMAPNNMSYKQLFKFIINHPKSLTQLMPFYYSQGAFIYDINMSIVWGVLIAAIGTTIYFTI